MESYPGEYVDEGGFRGGGRSNSVNDNNYREGGIPPEEIGAEAGGFMRPDHSYPMSESEVYSRLNSAGAGPYPVNGTHPYEEELHQRRTPIMTHPPQTSPGRSVTPSMGMPPPHLNHDTYAPPSLLRSTSADSTSRGLLLFYFWAT